MSKSKSIVFISLGKDLLATDVQFSDSYLLLAVHLLVDIWEETGKFISIHR